MRRGSISDRDDGFVFFVRRPERVEARRLQSGMDLLEQTATPDASKYDPNGPDGGRTCHLASLGL